MTFDIHAPATPEQRQWLAEYHARIDGALSGPTAATTNQSQGAPVMSQSEANALFVRTFNHLVEAEMAKGCSRQQAIKQAARREPELHQRYIEATNSRKSFS